MKTTHLLTIACGLALIASVALFIGYATETRPQQKQRMITTLSEAQQGDSP